MRRQPYLVKLNKIFIDYERFNETIILLKNGSDGEVRCRKLKRPGLLLGNAMKSYDCEVNTVEL